MLGLVIAHIRGPLSVYQALCRGFYTFCPVILAARGTRGSYPAPAHVASTQELWYAFLSAYSE